MPHVCETCRYYSEPWEGPHCRHCGDQDRWEAADEEEA